LDFVGTGLVLQDESFRMNPCPNSIADSHKGCPYDNHSLMILSQKGFFQHSLKANTPKDTGYEILRT